MFKLILFDLDETLYPRSSSLMPIIGARITRYVVDKMGISPDEADSLRKHWRLHYGTALRGMMEERYPVDVDEYLRYVHDIPLDGVLEPQPAVRAMLLDIPLHRVILTNSDSEHAEHVLRHIRLFECFERIIDIRALNFINKPDPRSYELALQIADVPSEQAILVEDTPVNTKPAMDIGMTTILVDCPPGSDAHYRVATVLEVGGVVKQLLRQLLPRDSVDR